MAPFAVPPTLVRLSVGHRVGGRSPHRSRARARGRSREPIDLHHQAPGIVGCYLLDTDDGPALFDCGPATQHRPSQGRPAPSAGSTSPRSGTSCSRTSTSTMPERRGSSCARARGSGSRLRGRRTAPDRSDEARVERPAPVRGRVRRALGRARARPCRERAHRRRSGRRARLLPDSRARLASRVVPRQGRDALRRRRSRRTDRLRALRRSAVPPAGVRPRRLGADDRRDRDACTSPTRAHPFRRLRRRPGAPRASSARRSPAGRHASRTGWTSRPSSRPPATTSSRSIRSSPTTTTARRRTGTTSAASSATGASGARRRGGIIRRTERVRLELGERDELERRCVRRLEDDGRRHAGLERLLPPRRDHAPAVSRLQARKHPLRLRGDEVVAGRHREVEELVGHHGADRMEADIDSFGTARAVAEVARQRIERARLELAAEDVHPLSPHRQEGIKTAR